MVRTVIALDERQRAWLDREAARRRVSRTSLVREAVSLLAREQGPRKTGDGALLDRTRGLWRRGDGLRWQTRLRDGW